MQESTQTTREKLRGTKSRDPMQGCTQPCEPKEFVGHMRGAPAKQGAIHDCLWVDSIKSR
eukprot:3462593-Pleurochrysis_carterae.AAC.1